MVLLNSSEPVAPDDPSASECGMEVRVVTRERDLEALAPDWDALVEACLEPSPFVSFPWLRAWWRAFGAGREMHLVAVWQGPRLVGLAPLAYQTLRQHGRSLRELAFWSNAYSNRIHFLVHREAPGALERIIDHVVAGAPAWDLWLMEPVLSESALTRGVLAALEARGLRHGREEVLRSPFLELPSSFDAVLSQLTPSFRRSLRRKVRTLVADAGIRLSIREDAGALEAAFDVAGESWQHAEGTSIASTETLRGFYREVSLEAARRGWLQIPLLERGTEPLSFEYNLVFHGVVHNLKLGYRASCAALSPGLVLKHHVLSEAIAAGRLEYDFLGMDEHYKTQWSSGIREHQRVTVFGDRLPLPAVHFYRHRLKPAVRRRLPGLVRRKNAFVARLRGARDTGG